MCQSHTTRNLLYINGQKHPSCCCSFDLPGPAQRLLPQCAVSTVHVPIYHWYNISNIFVDIKIQRERKMSAPIGFVGIGIMGRGMLNRLVNNLDSTFVIWNRSSAISEEFRDKYPNRFIIASNPADVVRKCDVTFSVLSTLDASVAVFNAETDSLWEGVSEGKIVVDCATLSPERMIEMSQVVRSRGGQFLEAPVSGSKVPAETGQLIFLCGGEQTTFDAVGAYLDIMGKAKFLFGEVGQGTRVKLVVNMALGTIMSAFSETLTLGKACDIPLDALLQVIDLGAMSSPMFKGKGPNMIVDNFAPHFPLKHQQKDLQ